MTTAPKTRGVDQAQCAKRLFFMRVGLFRLRCYGRPGAPVVSARRDCTTDKDRPLLERQRMIGEEPGRRVGRGWAERRGSPRGGLPLPPPDSLLWRRRSERLRLVIGLPSTAKACGAENRLVFGVECYL